MAARLTPVAFQGWDALRLDNGLITAHLVPEIGGRLLQFALGGHPFLFSNRALDGQRFTPEEHQGDGSLLSWKNYGGDKTWPAPQGWDGAGQWPGPPDNVLDSGPYQASNEEANGSANVTMRSAADARTGLHIERRLGLTAGSSRLQLDLAFENVSQREIRWSIWDIAQLDCEACGNDGWLYVPIDPDEERPWHVLFGEENSQLQPDFRPGLFALNYQGIVGKIGLRSPGGWLAFADQRAEHVLCMQFPHEPDAEYPDGGATVECWTEMPGVPTPVPIDSPGHILEAEVLGPLRTLQPGERTTLPITWSAARCPGPVLAVVDAGCVHQRLSAQGEGKALRLTGVFGVFHEAPAELAWLDGDGATLSTQELGAVSPLAPLLIDVLTSAPDGARSLRLQLRCANGETLELERCKLPTTEG
ncbi:MAG: DUF4380 domain-containing protein [Anaerolineaceae bacterium]|nr:DUF4380 domain-containing protein [Anaerolineaceae bacterium]